MYGSKMQYKYRNTPNWYILLVKTAQIEEGTIQITISAELKDRHHMMGEVVFVKERITCFCHIG